MKCTVSKTDLQAMVELCKSATDPKAEAPTSQCILLSAEGMALSAYATDLFMSVFTERQCAVAEPGKSAIQAERLRAAVRAMPDGMLTLKSDPKKDSTTITCAGSKRRYQLPGLAPDLFSERTKAPRNLTEYCVPGDALKELVSRVKNAAAAPGIGKEHMAVVQLEFIEGEVRSLATDGSMLCRLAKAVAQIKAEGALGVPVQALPALLSLAGEGAVTFCYTHEAGFVSAGTSRLSYQLLNRGFPNMQHVLERVPNQVACKFDVEQVSDSLKAVTAVFRSTVHIALKDSVLSIQLDHVQDGESEDFVLVDGMPGKYFSLSLEPGYLSVALEGVGGGVASIKFDSSSDWNQPLMLESDDGFLAVIALIRPV